MKSKIKNKMKTEKIKMIVEGVSDRIFLNELFRKLKIRKIDIEVCNGSSIKDNGNIKKIIKNANEDGYKKIIILIDKITHFNYDMINSSCPLDIRDEYKKKVLKELQADIIVVDEEIECWFILGENIKNFYKNCFSEVKTLFNSTSKQQIAQRAVKKLDLILANRDKNRSFDYFLKKIGI